MAFNRQPESVLELLAKARRWLRDDEADVDDEDRGWTNQELRDYGNASIALRAMEMGLTGEHATAQSHYIDLVAGVRAYPLPAMISRPEVIFLRFEDNGVTRAREIPLRRNDRISDSYSSTGGWPTVRLEGNQIMIEPPPDESRVRGLRLHALFLPPRLLRADDTAENLTAEILDAVFPDFYEELFVYDIVEFARGNDDRDASRQPPRAKYELLWKQFIQKRMENRVLTKPFIVT